MCELILTVAAGLWGDVDMAASVLSQHTHSRWVPTMSFTEPKWWEIIIIILKLILFRDLLVHVFRAYTFLSLWYDPCFFCLHKIHRIVGYFTYTEIPYIQTHMAFLVNVRAH